MGKTVNFNGKRQMEEEGKLIPFSPSPFSKSSSSGNPPSIPTAPRRGELPGRGAAPQPLPGAAAPFLLFSVEVLNAGQGGPGCTTPTTTLEPRTCLPRT